ncbi:unnamed protein product [Rangifer tarandus platyrhynchus]|uniref:Uncharacterized protein n=2 Tax=Rangifer tarandus platyrhynchus TaxID=3082113 RepID=A0ABN8Z4K5_RANTA|nr:unnamed protein product [Rangifer tarandus platyrhynchus]CAI9703318.1 unnamed protein product [Rangifer tarandus platyrhynchus]
MKVLLMKHSLTKRTSYQQLVTLGHVPFGLFCIFQVDRGVRAGGLRRALRVRLRNARSRSPSARGPQAHPPRGAGCSGRQGAPGPRVRLGPGLLRLRGLPDLDAQLQIPKRGDEPFTAPARAPRGQPLDARSLRGPRAALGAALPPQPGPHSLHRSTAGPRVYPDRNPPAKPSP